MDDCMKYLFTDGQTLYDVLHRGRRVSNNGDCLGTLDTKNRKYHWISYKETIDQVKQFGSGLVSLGLTPGSHSKIGIYSVNTDKYVIAEYAAYNHSMVVVPLYDTLGRNAVTYIVNEANIECILVECEKKMESLINGFTEMSGLKYIILLNENDIPQNCKNKAVELGLKVYTFHQVMQLGKANPKPIQKPNPNDLAVVCYTSGTTGNPKGVMLTHGNIIATVSAVLFTLSTYTPTRNDTFMSFLPLAHMFERCCHITHFMVGARIGFYSGDTANLLEDMQRLKPTIMACVPRIFNRIHHKSFAKASTNKLKLWLFNKALRNKGRELEKGIIRSNGFWDKLVFKPIREGMGGKLRLIIIAGAPLDPAVMNFMRCALGCIIVEAYGQTECVGPCTVTIAGDTSIGHVGPPLPCCHVKLVDVPDMNYYARDGKGEICVKGTNVSQGYLNNPSLTAEAIDQEGWLHTGDIGSLNDNGTLTIIDRKKHIFKLSQGEYISPEKIESVYAKSNFVSQIFIHGDSLKSSLVGVVVPDNDVLIEWGRVNKISATSLDDLCQNERVKKAILDDFHAIGRQEELKSYEQVKDIYLCPDAFSIDNGLLTPTLKLKRPECRKFFSQQLDDMYRSIN